MKYVSLAILLFGFGLTACSAPTDDAFQLSEVAEGIFVHKGVHAQIDSAEHAHIANIGFIIGERCVAVVDTGGSIKIGQSMRQAIRNKTDRPVCYVINSHVHFDHILGNAAFLADKPQFVGHVNLAEAVAANRPFFLENFAEDLGENATEDLIISPDLLVEDTLEIDLGNRILLLTANPKAHTNHDLTVLDKQTNTLWLADLLFMERVPSLDGSLLGWHKLMDKLHDEKFDRVIPGHGQASFDWPAAMAPQQQYFDVLINESRSAIADGKSLQEALDTIGQSEKEHWLLFDEYHRRAVNRAFRELEWE